MKQRIESIIRKRKHLVILSVATVAALSVLAACSFAAPKDENTVSDEAQKVIEVMMTAPNHDLIPKLMYGLGMNYTEEEKAAILADHDRVLRNWENAIGPYFSEGLVVAGINNNTVNAFQTRWEAFGKEYAVVDMVRTFKDEKREEVAVTYTADGEEHQILIRFRINTDGKFYEVELDYVDDSIEGHVNILKGPEEPDEAGKETAAKQTSSRDFPSGETRLSVLGENDEIWITMTERTTSQGNSAGSAANMELTVYTQEGKFVQDISYLLALGKDVHLIDIIRSPADYLTLEDVNRDGADDIKAVIATQSNGEKLYRCFIWDPAAKQFMEET